MREKFDSVTLIGEDTDLLVLLIHFAKCDGVFMMRPGKLGKSDRVANIFRLQQNLGVVKEHMLFLHAVTGCDTTSCL